MRLLIDECLPRRIKRLLKGHLCRTVQEMGWAGRKNGVLVSLAEREFDALVTLDQGIQYQQMLDNHSVAILVLLARSNKIEDIEPVIPAALTALRDIQPGKVIEVGQS